MIIILIFIFFFSSSKMFDLHTYFLPLPLEVRDYIFQFLDDFDVIHVCKALSFTKYLQIGKLELVNRLSRYYQCHVKYFVPFPWKINFAFLTNFKPNLVRIHEFINDEFYRELNKQAHPQQERHINTFVELICHIKSGGRDKLAQLALNFYRFRLESMRFRIRRDDEAYILRQAKFIMEFGTPDHKNKLLQMALIGDVSYLVHAEDDDFDSEDEEPVVRIPCHHEMVKFLIPDYFAANHVMPYYHNVDDNDNDNDDGDLNDAPGDEPKALLDHMMDSLIIFMSNTSKNQLVINFSRNMLYLISMGADTSVFDTSHITSQYQKAAADKRIGLCQKLLINFAEKKESLTEEE